MHKCSVELIHGGVVAVSFSDISPVMKHGEIANIPQHSEPQYIRSGYQHGSPNDGENCGVSVKCAYEGTTLPNSRRDLLTQTEGHIGG